MNKPYLFFLKFVPSTLLMLSIVLTVHIMINIKDPQIKSMLCLLLCLILAEFMTHRFLIKSLEKLTHMLLSVTMLESEKKSKKED